MSGAAAVVDRPELLGRCASCRWSEGRAWAALVCLLDGEGSEAAVKRVWTCERYSYEPGSLS